VLINPIIQTRTRHFRRAYHPTRDRTHTNDDKISFIVRDMISKSTRRQAYLRHQSNADKIKWGWNDLRNEEIVPVCV
jgi:hypothetical protein